MPESNRDVNELLLDWEEAREQGRLVTPEDLCRSCPDLLPELRRKIAALVAMDPVLRVEPSAGAAVVPEQGSESLVGEIERILRLRLRVAGCILLTLCLSILFLSVIDDLLGFQLAWYDFVFAAAGVAVTLGLLLPLMLPVPMSLWQLRVCEALIFGTCLLLLVYAEGRLLNTGWLDTVPADRDSSKKSVAFLLIDAVSAPWVILIILYGTFIPNPCRRCAWVVGLMWLTPLVMVFTLWSLSDPGTFIHDYLVPQVITGVALELAIPVVIAVYGSYKIGRLQHEAFEARKLGQYKLRRLLGRGGMGEVYLAEHKLLRRPCAIKLIRPERSGDRQVFRRFEREVQAMATLTHWNTVEIFDYGHSEDGTFYYVMEYLPGLTLEQIVDKYGPIPAGRAVHLLRQVCHALREAHGIGLIHRDIKPSNIIVCERGGVFDVVKLLDFGLVKSARETLGSTSNQITLEGVVPGTPLYMSPEQAAVSQRLDPRSDLCSLGAVAYFMLTGQPPFQRDSVVQIFAAHMREPVIPPSRLRPDVPLDLESVVMKCLEKDPANRYPSARELEKALAACACAADWTQEAAERWWLLHGADLGETRADAEERTQVVSRR